MNTRILPVLVAGLLSACAADATPSDSEVVNEVSARVGTWKAALEARDVPGLAEHYLQNSEVVVMWPGPVPGTTGVESITWHWDDEDDAQAAFLTAMEALTVSVSEMRVVALSSDSAAVSATAELYLTVSGSEEGVSIQSRVSLVLVKRDGKWLIAQEHISADPAAL